MTACDYKFFPAQAAQTKTLKLQQKKGQSKPSSPSYYNKSLVPTSAFTFITIVRADENKNNSSHSKINLRLISPRLSLEIKTTDHTGRGVYSYGQRLECCPVGFPWDAHRGPLCNPNGKKQKKRQCSPCLQFVRSILSEVPLGARVLAGSILAASGNYRRVVGSIFWSISHLRETGMGLEWLQFTRQAYSGFPPGGRSRQEDRGRAGKKTLQPPPS